ncbi:hypothetical protein ACIBCO_02335 [Streptomyces violascens]|uniref:hypothetical protein n=1 Tax=Streptomyces violascens TaxID=67381 RepID=UPI00379851A7
MSWRTPPSPGPPSARTGTCGRRTPRPSAGRTGSCCPFVLGIAVLTHFRGIRTSYARRGRTPEKARQVQRTSIATGVVGVAVSLVAFAAEARHLLTH